VSAIAASETVAAKTTDRLAWGNVIPTPIGGNVMPNSNNWGNVTPNSNYWPNSWRNALMMDNWGNMWGNTRTQQ
jgi:hypothetical protein